MKLWNGLAGFFALCYLPFAFAAQSPEGMWTTFDDKSGVKRAIVNLQVKNGELSGTLAKIFPEPGDKGICSKCPGAFKDKPITGLLFVWGLKDQGNGVWDGGSILDPKSGTIYKAKMTVKGNNLDVRGYIGLSMLGRTQVWKR